MLNDASPPTPKQLAALFRKYRVEPDMVTYFEIDGDRPRGCAIGVLIRSRTAGDAEAERLASGAGDSARRVAAELTGLSLAFVEGIDCGFTTCDGFPWGCSRTDPDFHAGHALGRAAGHLVFGLPADARTARTARAIPDIRPGGGEG